MELSKKTPKRTLSIILAAILTVSALTLSGSMTAKADSFNDTDPDLTLVNIDGIVETENGHVSYIPQGELKQNNGNYDLRSNSFCVWGTQDDVSFAYRKYNVAPIDSDSLTIETTLTDFYSDTPDKSLPGNASAGIMIRSGLGNTASTVFFHIRADGLMIVYRQKTGGGWGNTAPKKVSYPVKLKVVVNKNTVECRYRTESDTTWRLAGYVSIQYDGPLYAGIGVHSLDEKIFARGIFSGLRFYGTGSYSDGDGKPDTPDPDKPIENLDPDLDLSGNSNIVLYETFSNDNKLAIAKDAGTNKATQYVWNSGKKGYDNSDTTGKLFYHPPLYADKKVENGNRFLYKSLMQDSIDYIGDESWSDYKVSMDFQYTDRCEPNAKLAQNRISLSARSRIVEWYGYSDYAVTMQNEIIDNRNQTTVSLYKHVNNTINNVSLKGARLAGPFVVDNFLGDGKWHNVAISVFDNIISIYYDGQKLAEYVDNGRELRTVNSGTGDWEEIIGFGNIGVATYQTDCYIDNIIVELTPDTLNGDYDNYVGGGWDKPIPNSVKNWTTEKGYAYYFNGINGNNGVGSKIKK